MEYRTITTNDGIRLAYQTNTTKQHGVCLLLLHGFSGSSEYFTRNTPSLCEQHWVVAPDMRGHGKSEHSEHGYHVARLAMDLHEIIHQVILTTQPTSHIYAVGCSIGAAVLWTYVELFGDKDFAAFVFVDQAPLQDRSLFGNWGVEKAHYGCYDEATTLAAQKAWSSAEASVREETYRGLVDGCLGYRYKLLPEDDISSEQRNSDEDFFTSISRSCDGVWLAKLLADHTRYDHREAISLIAKPIRVMAGQRSGCFSIEGQEETLKRAKKSPLADLVVFSSGHWLFWEEPEKFNAELLNFIAERETERSSTRG